MLTYHGRILEGGVRRMRQLRLIFSLTWLAGVAAGKFPPLKPPGEDKGRGSKVCPRCGKGVLQKEDDLAFCPICKKFVGPWS
jgi:hypothetical protein